MLLAGLMGILVQVVLISSWTQQSTRMLLVGLMGILVQVVVPYMSPYVGAEEAAAVAANYMARCRSEVRHEHVKEDTATNEEVLCNCDFSLAYGTPALGSRVLPEDMSWPGVCSAWFAEGSSVPILS